MQISARDKIRDVIEAAVGQNLQLFAEFTGLISWRRGSFIGAHRDDNQDYLAQRQFAAVLYLNQGSGRDFSGGAFHFYHPDEIVVPRAGRLITYSTSQFHSVEAVTEGERFTLTMWFTTDAAYDEDRGIVQALRDAAGPCMGIPPTMHAFQDGVDLRICRLACVGLGMAFVKEGNRSNRSASSVVTGLQDGEWQGERVVQILVNPAILRTWLPGDVKDDGYPADLKVSSSCAASFASVIQGLQRWVMEQLGDRYAMERVCCRHLSSSETKEVNSCEWLVQLSQDCRSLSMLTPSSDVVCGRLAEMVRAEERTSKRQQEAFMRTQVAAWIRDDAVYDMECEL